jgi:hypothetical protein
MSRKIFKGFFKWWKTFLNRPKWRLITVNDALSRSEKKVFGHPNRVTVNDQNWTEYFTY